MEFARTQPATPYLPRVAAFGLAVVVAGCAPGGPGYPAAIAPNSGSRVLLFANKANCQR